MTGGWDGGAVALLRLDRDGTVVDANRTVLRWTSRTRSATVGRVRLEQLLTPGGRIYWETHLAPILHAQGRVEEVALALATPGGRLPVLLTAVVGPGPDDTPGVEVALVVGAERSRYEREIDAARRAAEASAQRLRALHRTSTALAGAFRVSGVADALLLAASRELGAGAAVVRVLDEAGTPLERSTGDAASVAALTALLTTPAAAGPAQPHGPGGPVVVALPGRERTEGVLAVAPSAAAGADPLDVDVLEAVGRAAGTALERARLLDENVSVAHRLQLAMLATREPVDPRMRLATLYRPGVASLEVGGDWYDAFRVDEDRLALAVGDVVGRGLEAATAMGRLRSAVRAVAGPGARPAEVLDRADRFVTATGAGMLSTMAYAEVDLVTGRLRYAVAAHPPPLLLDAAGDVHHLWDGRSTPLGLRPADGVRGEAEARLAPGSTLLLYTDGLVERRDRPLSDGLDALAALAPRLRTALEGGRAGGLGGGLAALVSAALPDPGAERDDVCVVALARPGRGAPGA
ncbi:SpoIIE family protein phosphatase [Cellulomonas endophytica]|uniref:SpoIIE family protein phosphatase n=1 Tax=Cellulomonas endophytica TaxID=2494735 RepID=UPI0010101DCE|nr:SpoIIE family protein phosphatase [Cellulomonas endophytica]